MNILDQITSYKKREVAAQKAAFSIGQLQKSAWFERDCYSMATSLRNASTGIIAEHKRRSPSKSVINEQVGLPEVVQGYVQAGVAVISVLTDTRFFGGSLNDLALARRLVAIPLLRKEFIVDVYQIYEAKAYGADAILLIAACLSPSELKEFSTLAKSLGLEVLLEVHNELELEKSLHSSVDMIGVNNRDLKTFSVSLETSKKISEKIPADFVKVSESGISSIDAIKALKPYGYQGFLIGEHFMKTENPGENAQKLINALR